MERWALPRYVAFGVTSVRSVHGRLDSALALRDEINLGGTLAPRIWSAGAMIDGVPLTRYWLIPPFKRPKIYSPHPLMSAEDIRTRTQEVWDRFYSFSAIWQRSTCVQSLRARLAFVLISKLYRQMYANTGIATDSARVARSARRARVLARAVRRLFVAAPMPELQEPQPQPNSAARKRLTVAVIP